MKVILAAGSVGLVTVGIVVGFGMFRSSALPTPVPLPDDAQVESMTAEVFEVMGLDPVPEFEIRPEYVPQVLHVLRFAETDSHPAPRHENVFCRLSIRTTDGRTLTIAIPWLGKEPLAFTLDGIRYVRQGPFEPVYVGEREIDRSWTSENCTLVYALMDMRKPRPLGEKNPAHHSWLYELERSAGLRPPRKGPIK
jgi:hypothetical protein